MKKRWVPKQMLWLESAKRVNVVFSDARHTEIRCYVNLDDWIEVEVPDEETLQESPAAIRSDLRLRVFALEGWSNEINKKTEDSQERITSLENLADRIKALEELHAI